MIKLLSLISLILTIVLFPPAVLALISNNAVPGDRTYPIKRSLENIILAAVSINPNTKAAFSQTRSDRRYKEFSALIAKGKETTGALNDLVEQTDMALSTISQVTNPQEKERLIAQLSSSIERYDVGLQDASSSESTIALAQQPAETTALADSSLPDNKVEQTPSPVVTAIARRETSTSQPSPTLIPRPTATTTPRPTATSHPTPSPSLQPTPGSSSTAQPTPTPVLKRDEEAQRQRNREIEEARRRLEEIGRQLEQERRRSSISTDKHQDEKKQNKDEKTEKSKEKEAEKNSKEDKSDNSDDKKNN